MEPEPGPPAGPPPDPPAELEEGRARSELSVALAPAYLLLIPCFVLHVLLGSVLQQASLPFGLGYSELFFFALPPAAVALAYGLRPAALLGLRAPGAATLLPVLGVALTSFPVAGGLAALNKAGVDALSKALYGRTLTGFDQAELFAGVEGAQVYLLVVAVVLLAPLGEELLFRGYLLRVLGARYGRAAGLVITAALFAAIHLNPTIVVGLFGLGLAFGAVRQLTGSLWPAVLLHAIQNGTSVVLLLAGVESSPEEELGVWPALMLIAVAGPFLWLAFRKLASLPAREEGELRGQAGRGDLRGLAALALAAVLGLGAWVAIDGAGLAAAYHELYGGKVSGGPSAP